MANFITCWLQDPGDLPPGDGPPGGNGIVIPPDDDDDDGCTGQTEYCGCIVITESSNWNDVVANETGGCNQCGIFFNKICNGTEPECRLYNGCMVCKKDSDSGANDPGGVCGGGPCCTRIPENCDGYLCEGDGTADIPCTNAPEIGDSRGMWEDGCKDSSFGCGNWYSESPDVCYGFWRSAWLCKNNDNNGPGNCRWKPGDPGGGGPGPTTPPPAETCWGCPSYGCCEQGLDKCKRDKDSGLCPSSVLLGNCYETKDLCDVDDCYYYCWECNADDHKCLQTKKTRCTDDCYYPEKTDCDPYCIDDDPYDCWRCPSPDGLTPAGCCIKDVAAINGKCPPNTYKKKKKCEQDCPKRCWNCSELGEPCTPVTIACDQACVEKGYHDLEGDCNAACTDDPPCTKDCYTCKPEPPPGTGSVCGGITVSCESETDTCESLGYYTEADCDGTCDAEEGAQSSYGSVNAYNRIYGSGGTGNPIYEESSSNLVIKNNAQFVGVQRGDLRQDLFKSRVHVGIRASLDIIRGRIQYSDNPFTDLSDSNLEKSINDDIILKLNLARDATGKPLKRFFLSSIRNLIISNRLDSFNVLELIQLLDRIIRNQDTEEYKDTRSYAPISRLDSISNEASAIQLATQKVWPLDPAQYAQTRVAERMRTWKTLATDLSKGLPVTTSTGATTTFYYSNYDTIVLGGSGTLTMSNGDLQKITLSDGSIAEIPVQSLIKRAGILSTEVLQKLLYLLGDRYDINLKVTTDETLRVDERYGVTKDRKNIYLLALQPGTVNDLERINPFVARSTATYKYLDSADSRDSHVNVDGSGSAFPSLEVYLDINDPILSYIENDGDIEVTFKDFVLDLFDEEDQQNITLPVIARRAPQTIAIYTTDITANVITHNISKSTSYGVREIKLLMSPDTFGTDTWHPTFIKEDLAYPDRGINPSVVNNQAVQYSMATKALSEHNLYRSGSQPAERILWGERQVYKLAREFKSDYQLPSSNTINWWEIYDRMGTPQKKFLHRECANFDKFKSLLSMGKPALSSAVNAKYPKVKEFRSTNWLGNTNFSTPLDKEKKRLNVIKGHTPIPVEPVD